MNTASSNKKAYHRQDEAAHENDVTWFVPEVTVWRPINTQIPRELNEVLPRTSILSCFPHVFVRRFTANTLIRPSSTSLRRGATTVTPARRIRPWWSAPEHRGVLWHQDLKFEGVLVHECLRTRRGTYVIFDIAERRGTEAAYTRGELVSLYEMKAAPWPSWSLPCGRMRDGRIRLRLHLGSWKGVTRRTRRKVPRGGRSLPNANRCRNDLPCVRFTGGRVFPSFPDVTPDSAFTVRFCITQQNVNLRPVRTESCCDPHWIGLDKLFPLPASCDEPHHHWPGNRIG